MIPPAAPPPSDDGPVVLRPHPWYLAALAAIGLLVLALIRLAFDWDWSVLIVALGGPFGAWFSMRLTLDERGVSFGRRDAPWSMVELRRVRFSGQCLATPPSVSRAQRIVVWLAIFEPGWRTGRIGAALRRWRPDLLESVPADGRR